MRRASFVLGLILVLALGISAVSAQDSLANVDPTGQTITYWHQYQDTGAQGKTIAAIIDAFNKTNQYKITVQAKYQGNYGQISQLVNAGITSGELPNLVAGYADDAASYAQDNSVVDLKTYIDDPKWGLGANPDINQGLLATDTVNGKVLAFPNQSSAEVMAYNSTLLKQAGFDGSMPTDPATFEKEACAASKLKDSKGNQVQGFALSTDSSPFESWVASMGGAIYHDGKYDFMSDAVKNTLQLYQDMYKQGCAYFPAQQYGDQADFNNGVLPFYVTSTAGISYIISGFTQSGVKADWDISTFPHTQGNEIVQAFAPSIIMMPSTPEAQLASWIFLKYLATPDVAVQWSTGSGYFNPVPSTAATLKTATFGTPGLDKYFNEANAQLNNPNIKVYGSPALASYSKVRDLVSTAIADVTSNGKDVATVMQTLQQGADAAQSADMAATPAATSSMMTPEATAMATAAS